MSLLWTNDLTIGIIWIDNQHKKLIEKINGLSNAIKENRGEVEIGTILKFLEEYTKAHFDTEEKYMLNYQYPGYQTHKKEHELFKQDLKKLREEHKFLGASRELAQQIEKRVINWYLDHIAKVDKSMGTFLRSKVWKRGTLEEDDSLPSKDVAKREKELLELVVRMIKSRTKKEKLNVLESIQNILSAIEMEMK